MRKIEALDMIDLNDGSSGSVKDFLCDRAREKFYVLTNKSLNTVTFPYSVTFEADEGVEGFVHVIATDSIGKPKCQLPDKKWDIPKDKLWD